MMTSEAAGRKNRMIRYIELQLLNILFSLAGVTVKFASNSWSDNGLFSLHTMLVIAAYVGMMAVYAFFWQRVIKKSFAVQCISVQRFVHVLGHALVRADSGRIHDGEKCDRRPDDFFGHITGERQ